MLFDLDPYLPFPVFFTLAVLALGAIAASAERNNRNR